MNIDFIDHIKESFNFTWKYKILWVFGFIIAFFAAFSNSASNTNGSDSSSSNTANEIVNSALRQDYSSFVNSPAFTAVMIGLFVLLIIVSILGWYLVSISQIALIRAVKHDDVSQPEKIKLGALWAEGNKYLFWQVLLLNLLWLLIGFVLFLIIAIPSIILIVVTFGLGIILICCAFIFLIPAFIVLGWIQGISYILVIYYDYGVMDSISESWRLIKASWKELLVGTLFSILPNLAWGIVSFIFAAIVVIPLAILFIWLLGTVESFALMATIGFVIILTGLALISAITAPLTVFNSVYWTKLVTKIKK